MKGIFYIHNNLPVIATEEKPDETSFYYQANGTHLVHAEYYEAIEEWERQLIPAENVFRDPATQDWHLHDKPKWSETTFKTLITPGQAIEYEGNVIHKIL